MPRIQQLPHTVITKISAGEVIERPCSVVKELLENAVDAGSNRVDVEIDQGGTERICVVDDGGGIHPADLPLAFASHATSKLASAEDLFQIGTLGFRGEALASIGGVAQVTLQSRPPDQPHGCEIACNGGELAPPRAWNGAPGTRIEVRNLFFNTPVRRKFLRTIATEMGHIDETFVRVALAQTHLHLTLRHNGKSVYEVPTAADLRERIVLFFGGELRDKLLAIERRAGPASLRGYIADPAIERGTAKMQYLFLNGRWIRDRSISHALQEAYRGLLMTGRYAVAFLFLDLPPELVDVNVHPTKSEVRFRDAQAIYHLVLSTVRERLRAEDLTPRLQTPKMQPVPEGDPTRFPSEFNRTAWSLTAPAEPTPSLPFSAPAVADVADMPLIGPVETPVSAPPAPEESDAEHVLPPLPTAALLAELPSAPLKAIQLYDAYLVLETPEGMLVIDQHALHERILFEQFKKRIQQGTLEVQPLLVPEPVDLPAEQAAKALEQRPALAELGLQIEDFGGDTILLRSYPAILGRRSPVELFKAVIDHLVSKERPPNREQLLNDLLSVMACRAAVKAGDRLTAEEIGALVAQRNLAENTHHCPHGRPTSLLFSRHELDRQFRRV